MEELLSLVKKLAPEAEVAVRATSGRRAATRFAVNEITTAVDADAGAVAVTVALGKRHASASTNRGDRASLEALAERAVQMARLAPEDPERMPTLGAREIAPVPAAYDEAAARLSNELRAKASYAAIELCAKAEVSGAGFYDAQATRELHLTSAGFRGEHASTSASFTMTARTPDGTGSGWAGAEDTRDLEARAIASRAIDRALRSRKPRPLAPGKYTVVLEPDAVGDLLSFLIEALGAREADEGRSYFSRFKLGDKLFASGVTLRSDPRDPLTPSRPFDGEGVPLEPLTFLDDGKLRALEYTRYWAENRAKRRQDHAASTCSRAASRRTRARS